MKTKYEDLTYVELPAGSTARGANLEDVPAALDMFNRSSRILTGRDEITDLKALVNDLQSPGFDIEQDTRVVFAPNGEMAGYIEAWTSVKPPVHPWIWFRVNTDYEDESVGAWLLDWADQRVLQALPEVPADLRFAPRASVYREATKARKLLEERGYSHIRSSYHMLIEMDTPVPEPVFPDGITLRTYTPGVDAEAAFRAQTDSFRDHFGHVEQPLEEGVKRFQHFWEDDGSDPSLMFLAMDVDQIAGINLCRPHAFDDAEVGWVGTLGVVRSWRKRGLGLALLRHSFNEFYRRGKRKVGLGVDAENLTGALRLYENAGMHVHQAFDMYEKELRPGKEISVQSLA